MPLVPFQVHFSELGLVHLKKNYMWKHPQCPGWLVGCSRLVYLSSCTVWFSEWAESGGRPACHPALHTHWSWRQTLWESVRGCHGTQRVGIKAGLYAKNKRSTGDPNLRSLHNYGNWGMGDGGGPEVEVGSAHWERSWFMSQSIQFSGTRSHMWRVWLQPALGGNYLKVTQVAMHHSSADVRSGESVKYCLCSKSFFTPENTCCNKPNVTPVVGLVVYHDESQQAFPCQYVTSFSSSHVWDWSWIHGARARSRFTPPRTHWGCANTTANWSHSLAQ